ncbi:G5 domain-containing protein [Clostridiaceae bacterium 35-E11]
MQTDLKNRMFLTKRNLIILGIVLLIGMFSFSNALTKEITIKDDNKEMKMTVGFAKVEDVLRKGNVKLNKYDQVSQSLNASVKDGMTIVIKRAHPVTIQVDGETREVMTANDNVEDILKEHKIAMEGTDRVEPALDASVKKYETITVARIREEIVTETEVIPYESIVQHNDRLDKGKLNLIQKGKNGEKEAKYKIVYENGQEISRELLEEKVITAPQKEVVEQGTAQFIATARGNLRVRKTIQMTATAYDATFESTGKNPGDKYYGITRSGTKVRPGVVAVDPRVIPLGTKLYVKALDGSGDYGFASAEDTGGAIKGNKIDLYFESPKDVKRYGKRKVQVYILE